MANCPFRNIALHFVGQLQKEPMPRILLIFAVCFTMGLKAQNDYFFERISPESGLVFKAIKSIAEDANGFVWFVTEDDIYYYNTQDFRPYALSLRQSQESNAGQIFKIYNDSYYNVWVCAEAGLFSFNEDINAFEQKELKLGGVPLSNRAVENIVQWGPDRYLLSIDQQVYGYLSEQDSLIELNLAAFLESDLNKISAITVDEKNNILLGTRTGRIYLINDTFSVIREIYRSDPYIVTSICSFNDRLFIGFNGNGVEVIDIKGNKLDAYKEHLPGDKKLPDDQVRQIIEREGSLWIGTYKGLMVLDSSSTRIIQNDGTNGLPHSSIYAIHKSKDGNMWIGTWSGGLVFYSKYNYSFQHFKQVPYPSNNPSAFVSSFAEDLAGNIWIGNAQSNISLFDPTTRTFIDDQLPSELRQLTHIKNITSENGKDFWIGSFRKGLWHYNSPFGKLRRVDLGRIDTLLNFSDLQAFNRKLWISTRGRGYYIYDIAQDSFQTISWPLGDNANWIWQSYLDNRGIWLATNNGLYTVDTRTGTTRKCAVDTVGMEEELTIYTVTKDRQGRLWAGTKKKGVYRYNPTKQRLEKFKMNDLIDQADVYSIVKDQQDDIWLSTNNGIFYYQDASEKARRFSSIDGLTGDLFNPNAVFLASDGTLYFGSPNGLNIIDPSIIQDNPQPPEVYISEIKINHQKTELSEESVGSSSAPEHISNLNLSHKQNSLSFRFVTNNFIKSSKNRYKYRLLNYQDNWVEIEQGEQVSFTKIPHGEYTLEVFGSNNEKLWSTEPLRVNIKIRPSFWQTQLAYLIYGLLFLALAVIVGQQLAFRVRTRKRLLDEKYKNEANEMLYAERLKFFTNISHEIKTPLTLIILPLDKLLKKFNYHSDTFNHLSVIKRSATRLLKLTNQILDLRLIEVGKLNGKFEKTDIVEVCRNVFDTFELQMKEQGINFIIKSRFNSFFVWVDPNMIENILYNLISNALKFSEEKGHVILSIDRKILKEDDFSRSFHTGSEFMGDAIEIRIRDYGVGIGREKISGIFERFWTGLDNPEYGAGIGLHMCSEYARLNHANLFVESQEGEGTTFSLHLPIHEHFEYSEAQLISQWNFDHAQKVMPLPNDRDKQGKPSKVILIAEDNDELRNYLVNIMNERYLVLSAKNGRQALEISREVRPDLIITDILMPGLDGVNLLKYLKSDRSTKHIPVMMLTALHEQDYQLESMRGGADSYLVKPVDESILFAQIENILARQSVLAESLDKAGPVDVHPRELRASFVQTAERIIEKNLQNSAFSPKDLAHELKISRSTLYRKIKQTSDENSSEFIRNVRLRQAIKLMKTGNYNLNEIGFIVGFNSTSYFNRSFKKKYGMTPKEYLKQLK